MEVLMSRERSISDHPGSQVAAQSTNSEKMPMKGFQNVSTKKQKAKNEAETMWKKD
jgi:hypothetical protein